MYLLRDPIVMHPGGGDWGVLVKCERALRRRKSHIRFATPWGWPGTCLMMKLWSSLNVTLKRVRGLTFVENGLTSWLLFHLLYRARQWLCPADPVECWIGRYVLSWAMHCKGPMKGNHQPMDIVAHVFISDWTWLTACLYVVSLAVVIVERQRQGTEHMIVSPIYIYVEGPCDNGAYVRIYALIYTRSTVFENSSLEKRFTAWVPW